MALAILADLRVYQHNYWTEVVILAPRKLVQNNVKSTPSRVFAGCFMKGGTHTPLSGLVTCVLQTAGYSGTFGNYDSLLPLVIA